MIFQKEYRNIGLYVLYVKFGPARKARSSKSAVYQILTTRYDFQMTIHSNSFSKRTKGCQSCKISDT